MQLDPLRDEPGEVITSARPLGMTGKPGLLPPGNPAPRRDRLPGGERGRGERSVNGCCRPVLAPVGEERHQNRQRLAQAGAVDNAVEHAARQQLFRRPGGLPARVPATGSDPGSWLGQDDVRLVRQRCPGRARRRVRQHTDERHPGAVEPRRGGGDLGRLDQPQQPLLGARAAGGAEGDEGETAGSGGLHGEEDLLARDRADAGAEEGVVEDDHHCFATADRCRAGEHRLADATAGTAEPLRRLSEAIGYRQQVAEDERVERHESGVRLPKAPLIDQQPQSLAAWNRKVAMATGADAVGLEGVGAGQLDPARRAGQRLLAVAGFSIGCDARFGNVQRKGLSREIRVAGAWVVSHSAPPR